jgi:hypothetical protein
MQEAKRKAEVAEKARKAAEARRKQEEEMREQEEYTRKQETALNQLAEMGFTDRSRNEELLKQSRNDVAKVIDRLSQEASAAQAVVNFPPPSQVFDPGTASQADRFAAEKLKLGGADQSDLKDELGLDDEDFAFAMLNQLQAMEQEWFQNGSSTDKANFTYITKGRARNPNDIPEHTKQELAQPGGTAEEDFDFGHDGMTAKDFQELEESKIAGLKLCHVVALRLYTSSSYPLFNDPIREGKKPHPIRVTMYVLDEALGKMRKVEAKQNREGYAQTKILWRGMKDRDLDLDEFKRLGGTELAPMSTTLKRSVAETFARGTTGGLIFRYTTTGHSRGVCIDFLSLYPKEKEYLYPPLTNLTFDEHAQDEADSRFKVINVRPYWS